MRSLAFRYNNLAQMRDALSQASDGEVIIPPQETVGDGEWVLAIFEIGEGGRATAAAARAAARPGTRVLVLEPRDWDRLYEFARADTSRPPEPAPPFEEPLFSEESPTSRQILSLAGLVGDRPSTVLVVEDDDRMRDMVVVMLEAVGLRVEGSATAEDALERLYRGGYDMVVLDWNLPGMSGLQLCRKLREDRHLALLPCVFLTGNTSPQDLVDAFAAGADDYLVKPFRAAELGARIFALLRRARLASAPRA